MIARLIGLAALVAASLTAIVPASGDPLVLDRVVLVMRHGIRPPTKAPPLPDGVADAAWPGWPVPPGNLTPHGAAAIRLLARYERGAFAADALVAATGCPKPGEVMLWADVDQRTIATGEAFAQGFAPGCPLAVGHAPAGADPLFSPAATGAVAFEPAEARAAIEARAGAGGINGVAAAHRAELAQAQTVLGCCTVAVCARFKLPSPCGLPDLPTTLKEDAEREPKLEGALAWGATLSEILLLEYAEGKPLSEVGFGRIDRAGLLAMLALHPAEFDLLHRAPYVAARGAAPLLRRIADLLDAGKPAPRLSVFVGHDTTLAYLGGALGLHWQAADYPRDDAPPGATLGFELLHDARGGRFVRIFYLVQTLDQLRGLAELSARTPPARITLGTFDCSVAGNGEARSTNPAARLCLRSAVIGPGL